MAMSRSFNTLFPYSTSQVPIFLGEHFDDWSLQMETFFISRDLWDVVKGACHDQKFEKENASALRFIQQGVGKKIYPKISKYRKAKDAWEILHKEFKKKERAGNSGQEQKGERGGDHDWVMDIRVMLGCLKNEEVKVKACSISIVPDQLRKGKEEAYSPKVVSVGPFHHGTRSDLQLTEETKWHYMLMLLDRAITEEKGAREKLKICSEAIREIDLVVRASYGGNIELKPEKLARIMILDGCFVLELLLKLYDYVNGAQPYTADKRDKNLDDPIMLGNIKNNILPVLIDLTLLENQIPFIVLDKLYRELSERDTSDEEQSQTDTSDEEPSQTDTKYSFPPFKQLAKSLFDYPPNSKFHVFHFLDLIRLSSIHNNKEGDNVETSKEAKRELKRCATKLRASGIKIQAARTPVLTDIRAQHIKFVDKFDLNIEFDGELNIPPLRIKEGTEVKWRNLIAWEQSGIGIGYKFTSYALFFRGLICSVHDIELLKDKHVIIVDDPKIKDENLLASFETITDGVKQMDSRYSKLCKHLNAKTVYCPANLHWRMWWHYCRRVLAWLREKFKIWILDFRKDYMPNPWVFIGVLAATALLALTIVQTYYAARGN